MYHDYTHVITNKEQVLQGLVKDARAVVAKITNQESTIREAFRGLSCELITEDNKLKNQDVLIEFAEAIRLQLEVEDFSISVLDTLASWKYSLKNLQNQVEICNRDIWSSKHTQEGYNDLATHW